LKKIADVRLRPQWMAEVQKLHDCLDAGGRVTQEQLPRSKFLSTQSVSIGICEYEIHQGWCEQIKVLLLNVRFAADSTGQRNTLLNPLL